MKQAIKSVASRPAIAAYRALPCRPLLHVVRKANNIQLTTTELSEIIASVRRRPRCRFLVFGLGNDSHFWAAVNRGGRTLFLEDHLDWIRQVTSRHPHLETLKVQYTTRITQWKELLERPEQLTMELPPEVRESEWDVVLVDAPAGWNDMAPGRMQSIAISRSLAAPGGDVFVHDCDREVEQTYSDRFLPEKGLLSTVGKLRHYRV